MTRADEKACGAGCRSSSDLFLSSVEHFPPRAHFGGRRRHTASRASSIKAASSRIVAQLYTRHDPTAYSHGGRLLTVTGAPYQHARRLTLQPVGNSRGEATSGWRDGEPLTLHYKPGFMNSPGTRYRACAAAVS